MNYLNRILFTVNSPNRPITIPARIPPIHRNGKYQSTWMLFRTSIATRICPMLWKIPPATLTKRRLKLVYFFRTNMAIKLSIPPAAEYIRAAVLPKVKLTSRILTILRAKASKALNRYKAIRTTRLVSPNLMPGIGKKYGICISTQESTKASAMSNPLSAILSVRNVFWTNSNPQIKFHYSV